MFSFIYSIYSGLTVYLLVEHLIFRDNWALAVDKRYGKIQYFESQNK